LSIDANFLGFGLVLLNADYVFDSPLDVEFLYILNELTCFQLGEAQDVLNVKEKQS